MAISDADTVIGAGGDSDLIAAAHPSRATDVDCVSDVARKYLQLHLASDVGPIRFRNLIERFKTIDAVLNASMAELESVTQVGPATAQAIFRSRDSDAADVEVERAKTVGVRILCLEDPNYPPSLLNTPDPPICLFVRGAITPTDSVAVAVVGTRRCSHYGREQAFRFGELLGGAGITVVSGLARGIDGHAHRGAINAGGRTIAVLGNGLGTVYPSEHESLAKEIEQCGAVVSECAIDVRPDAGNFPRRNRIIAGLTLGVLVIEAGKRSGALITARLAGEYNREVFALPGRVDRPEYSQGVHRLIRDGGAKLVTDLEDILDELGEVGRIMAKSTTDDNSPARTASTDQPSGPAKPEGRDAVIMDAMIQGAEDVDSLAEATGLATSEILTALTRLQLKGLVRQLPGARFAVATRGRE